MSESRPPSRTPDAAYAETDQARGLLQSRLARLSRLTFIVTLAFYPIGVLSRGLGGATGTRGLEGAFGQSSTFHLLAVAVFFAAWIYTRKGVRSVASLRVADAGMIVAGALTFEMMGTDVPSWVRPDLFTGFVVAQLLAIRAAIIPCTVRGSVWITTASVAPIPFFSYAFYRATPLVGGPSALELATNAIVLCLLIIVVSGIISRTVHGLRERVREAMKLGQYTLDEKIGEGGMGVVYKASHALLRRPTAIKLLPPERAGEHNLVRFEREVQLTSMLTHPNTVSVYDFGRTPDGVFYYAMEYLEGLDLQTLVEADGPQEPGRVALLLSQICGALAEAHGVGLIHRDVKPANVILCERGGTPDVVKVLDFGLVKQLGAPADVALSTSAEAHIVGTPLYLSPEAITRPHGMDARSDLYGLGAVGYFLLAGVPPFSGSSVVEVCGHHLHTVPTPPSERLSRPLPKDLEDLILQCLAKSSEERPASATALQCALLSCESVADWPIERAQRWWSEHGQAIRARKSQPSHGKPLQRSVLLTRDVGVGGSVSVS